MIVCKLCRIPIVGDDLRTAWKESAGWVRPKGADSMVGRHDTGELAHADCILKLRHGVDPAATQGSLL